MALFSKFKCWHILKEIRPLYGYMLSQAIRIGSCTQGYLILLKKPRRYPNSDCMHLPLVRNSPNKFIYSLTISTHIGVHSDNTYLYSLTFLPNSQNPHKPLVITTVCRSHVYLISPYNIETVLRHYCDSTAIDK